MRRVMTALGLGLFLGLVNVAGFIVAYAPYLANHG